MPLSIAALASLLPLLITPQQGTPIWQDCLKGRPDVAVAACSTLMADPSLSLSDRALALARRARAHADANQFDRAMIDVNAAIQLDPALAEAYETRGLVHEGVKAPDKALDDFTAALDLDPTRSLSWHERGWIRFDRDEAEAALADAEALLAVEPQSVRALTLKGRALALAKRVDEALDVLATAIALEGKEQSLAYFHRAVVHWKRGALDAALGDMTTAIDLTPGFGRAFTLRADILLELNRFDLAEEDYSRALALGERSAAVYTSRAWTRFKLGKRDAALADADAAIDLDATRPLGHLYRSMVLFELGRYEDSLKAADETVRLDPMQTAAHHERGLALTQLDRQEEAIAAFTAALPDASNRAITLAARAASYRLSGDAGKALADADAALALRPDYFTAHYQRALTLADLNRGEEALAALDRCLSLRADDGDVLFSRGIVLRTLNRLDESHADLTRAIDRLAYKASAHYQRARTYIAREDWDLALADLETAIRLDPALDMAFSWRGDVHRWTHKLEAAIADYDAAIRLAPQAARHFGGRCVAQLDAGRRMEAEADCRAAIRLDPNDSVTRFNLALMLQERNQLEASLAEYGKVIELQPDQAFAYNNRGLVLFSLGRKREAEADYRTAIRLDPRMAAARINLGDLLRDRQEMRTALLNYQEAVDLDPKSRNALFGLMMCSLALQRYENVVSTASRILSQNREDIEAISMRGLALQIQGAFEAAEADYRQLLRIDGRNAYAYWRLGQIAMEREDWLAAIDRFSTAISIYPAETQYYKSRGEAYLHLDRREEASADAERNWRLWTMGSHRSGRDFGDRASESIKQRDYKTALFYLDIAIALEPQESSHRVNRARTLVFMGQADNAMADVIEALAQRPDWWRALTVRGDIFLIRGDLEAARLDFDAAIAGNNSNGSIYFRRGRLHTFTGHPDLAIKDLETSLTNDPTTTHAKIWLALARRAAGRSIAGAEDLKPLSSAWPAPILDFMRGATVSEADVMAAARTGLAQVQVDQVCEATFYLAEWSWVKGRKKAAVKGWRKAAEICPTEFIERVSAVVRLKIWAAAKAP